jgi:hypothetical protein
VDGGLVFDVVEPDRVLVAEELTLVDEADDLVV